MTLDLLPHEHGLRVVVDTTDTLLWDEATARCLSGKTGRLVRWSELVDPSAASSSGGGKEGGGQRVERRCCNLVTMLSAQWHGLLEANGEFDGGMTT